MPQSTVGNMVDFHQELTYLGDFVKGTCELMCPESERLLREKENLLHPLEVALEEIDAPLVARSYVRPGYGHSMGRADPNRIVKSFSRSAAGQAAPSPADLRPAPVLLKAVDYLINNIASRRIEDPDWVEQYNFVTDRLRAVRQDMVIQGLHHVQCIPILEPMVKFHTFAAYWLCEKPISAYDPVINTTFLLECIKQLLCMYEARERRAASSASRNTDIKAVQWARQSRASECSESMSFCCDSRHLMESLYLILNLGDAHALNRALLLERVRNGICQKCVLSAVLNISIAWRRGDYVYMCRSLKNLPCLLIMAFVPQLPSIRRYALMVMSTAYSSKVPNVPVQYLLKTLLWERTEEVVEECSHYGITCHISESETKMNFQKGKFNVDAKMWKASRVSWLDKDLRMKLSEIFSLSENNFDRKYSESGLS